MYNEGMLNERFADFFNSLPKYNNFGEPVTVVGATKTIEPADIVKAVSLGLENVGENRVQELCDKLPYPPCNLHFIGHLQTNKVKYIIGKVSLIQSCDGLKLAQTIDRLACEHEIRQDILLEVNIGKEPQKSGIAPGALFDVYSEIAKLPGIRVKGLMTVLPSIKNICGGENANACEKIAELCLQMREMYDIIRSSDENVDVLSMGMSADYKIAVQNGSNMLRIGRLLFGERQPKTV